MRKAYEKTFSLLVMILLFAFGSAAATELTLNDCIDLALKHNKDVIRARNTAKTANANLWTAYGDFLPTLDVSLQGSESHTKKYTVEKTELGVMFDTVVFSDSFDPTPHVEVDTLLGYPQEYEMGGISKSYSLSGSAHLTLFNGGQNIFNLLGAKADRKYYQYLTEETEQGIIFSVKVSYYDYLKSLDKLEIAQEAVKRGEEQLKLAQSRFEVGSASKSDVLKAKVQYGNDKLGLISAENRVKISLANLKYLIGLDVNSSETISREYTPKEYSGSEEEALKLGLGNHPGLLAAENNVTVAKYDVRSTFGTYLPTLSASLSKGWSTTTWEQLTKFDSDDAHWSFGMSVTYPIFTGFERKRNMTRAKVLLNNARADLRYKKNDVALTIRESYLEINRSQEALRVAEENVLAAQEDMSLVREKYNLGAATILEVLDAQVSLITAQSAKVTAEFDYNLAVAGLERATGVR